jgi:hypothetical protein
LKTWECWDNHASRFVCNSATEPTVTTGVQKFQKELLQMLDQPLLI